MTAVLSLGSNLGDRPAHLRAALEVLGQHVEVVAVSSFYETEPVGGVAQPPYLNCVALVRAADAQTVLAAAQAAEDVRGRLRPLRWGPRTLDVDVVVVDGLTSADPRLTLPHPRAHERAFVLVPWLELDPAAELPGHGRVADLLRRLPHDDVRRVSS